MDLEITDREIGMYIQEGDRIIVDGNQIIVRTTNDNGDKIFITAENLSDAVGDTEFDLDPDTLYDMWEIA